MNKIFAETSVIHKIQYSANYFAYRADPVLLVQRAWLGRVPAGPPVHRVHTLLLPLLLLPRPDPLLALLLLTMLAHHSCCTAQVCPGGGPAVFILRIVRISARVTSVAFAILETTESVSPLSDM